MPPPIPIAPRPTSPDRPATIVAARQNGEDAASASGIVLLERRKRGRKRYSCAECRRLKLKCSKAWPCTMCERRGCAAICPDGVMERERRKKPEPVSELQQRIAVLEAAMKEGGGGGGNGSNGGPSRDAGGSVNGHPDRQPSGGAPGADRARTERALERERERERERDHTREREADRDGRERRFASDPQVTATAGSLSIGTGGAARYVGSLAGSAYLRDREERAEAEEASTLAERWDAGSPEKERHLGAGVRVRTAGGGGALGSVGGVLAGAAVRGLGISTPNGEARAYLGDIHSRLPDWEEGRVMAEAYWDNVNWIHQVIPRPTFENEYLPSAYEGTAHPHQLACVFFAMALGVMFDLSRPPFHPRARELFLLGRDCLERTHEKASLATVQALVMLGTYVLNDNDSNGAESYWPLLGNAVKIALSVGLHRDGEAFGLDARDADERRKVYWELMEYDRTQALAFGRPCGLSNRHADTKFPNADPNFFVDDSGYHHAKHCLVKMLERVVDIQVQPTPVPYSAVVDLDVELQEFRKSLPESLMCSVAIQDLPLDGSLHPHLVLQRFGIRLFIAEARLHLNRAAFVQALKASPAAPSHGTFAAAFVALYESAQEIVQVVKQLVLYSPALAERWWFFWFHAFSAAVCLAAIPIEAPTCGFATPAFSGLSIVCDLSAAARDGCRVKDGLNTLLGLRKRAREKLDATRHRVLPDREREGKDTKDDELHRLLLADRARPRESRERERDRDRRDGQAQDGHDGLDERAATRNYHLPNPLAPVRPSSSLALGQTLTLGMDMGLGAASGSSATSGSGTASAAGAAGQGTSLGMTLAEPSVAAGPTIPLWPDAASVLIDYAGLEGNAAFELSIQPFLNQLEGYAWGT